MSLSDLFVRVTETAAFNALVGKLRDGGVAVEAWLSSVNVNLSLSHIVAELRRTVQDGAADLAEAVFLQTATGEGLTLYARSAYQIERYPAVFSEHLFLLSNAATAPRHVLAAGDMLAGPAGASAGLFSSLGAMTLEPGGYALVRFTAQEAGPAGNIAARADLRLRTALVGASISNPPAIIVEGVDDNGGVGYATISLSPVQVSHELGASLSVTAIGQLVRVVRGPTTTAAQIAVAVNADTLARLLVFAAAQGTGASLAGDLAATTLTSSVVLPGQAAEGDDLVKQRCITRYSTTGAGGSEEAMIYWARALPAGYLASPVTKVKAYSNRYAGSIAGAAGTILVAGDAGALSPADLAAVTANLDGKYVLGTLVSVETTTNHTISPTGTVYVIRGRATVSDVQAAVAAALATYQAQLDIGGQAGKVYRQKLGARIEDAHPSGIRNVDLGVPATDVTILYDESVIFDPSGLVYELVDG